LVGPLKKLLGKLRPESRSAHRLQEPSWFPQPADLGHRCCICLALGAREATTPLQ